MGQGFATLLCLPRPEHLRRHRGQGAGAHFSRRIPLRRPQGLPLPCAGLSETSARPAWRPATRGTSRRGSGMRSSNTPTTGRSRKSPCPLTSRSATKCVWPISRERRRREVAAVGHRSERPQDPHWAAERPTKVIVRKEPLSALSDYAAISMAISTTTVFEVEWTASGLGGDRMVEVPRDLPLMKDFDADEPVTTGAA